MIGKRCTGLLCQMLRLHHLHHPSPLIQLRANSERASPTIREGSTNSTLADLCDVDVMPRELRKAHRDLDTVVEKLYRSAPFSRDRDRVEHLFGLYERLIAPLAVPRR